MKINQFVKQKSKNKTTFVNKLAKLPAYKLQKSKENKIIQVLQEKDTVLLENAAT